MQITISCLVATFATAGIVGATTTIGSNISTGGTLEVTGASTLTGNVTAAGTLSVGGTGTSVATASAVLGGAMASGSYYPSDHLDVTTTSDTTPFAGIVGGFKQLDTAGRTAADAAAVLEMQRAGEGGPLFGISVRANLLDGATASDTVAAARFKTAVNENTIGAAATVVGTYTALDVADDTTFGSNDVVAGQRIAVYTDRNFPAEGAIIYANALNATTGGTIPAGLWIENDMTTGSKDITAGLYLKSAGAGAGFTYGLDMNDATVDTAEIRLSNGETIDNTTDGVITLKGIASTTSLTLLNGETITNATNGAVLITSPVLSQAYDAAAYWTTTQADAGAVTFDSVSDGTAGFTFSDPVTISSKLDVHDQQTGGVANGPIIKKTLQAGEDYTTTTAGLMVKNYGNATATVSSGEFTGLYVNLKGLHTDPGHNTSLISAHVHADNTTTVHAGLWLYGGMTNGVKASGSTLTNMIDISEATAVTNLVALPAAGTAPVTADTDGPTTDAEHTTGKIKINVGGSDMYIYYYDN